jgi:hypothetical protein
MVERQSSIQFSPNQSPNARDKQAQQDFIDRWNRQTGLNWEGKFDSQGHWVMTPTIQGKIFNEPKT